MKRIAAALAFALVNLLHPRMLWLMAWPLLTALGLWGAVVLVFWAQAVLWLADVLRQWIQTATVYLAWDATATALFVAKLLIVLALVPLIQLTALLILGVLGLPAMVEYVAARRFPRLARRRGGSFAGSIWNSVVAVVGMALLGAVTLPLWIFPPLWPAIPVAIMGWANQRILRYDALAEHAGAEEMRDLFAAHGGALYALGVALALIAYVPLIGFFAPVLFGLAFIHFLLGALEALRAAPIEGKASRL